AFAFISVASRTQASGDISLIVRSIGNGIGVIAALIGRAVASDGEGGSIALGQTSETNVQVAANGWVVDDEVGASQRASRRCPWQAGMQANSPTLYSRPEFMQTGAVSAAKAEPIQAPWSTRAAKKMRRFAMASILSAARGGSNHIRVMGSVDPGQGRDM